MKERPILFSGAMVRALLDGSKTQTRRVCKPMNSWVVKDCREVRQIGGVPHHFMIGAELPIERLLSPYGQPGDRLYVRETHDVNRLGVETFPDGSERFYAGIAYRADDGRHEADINEHLYQTLDQKESRGWTPSIHMPRWASRITLEVTGVRVERLNDCSQEDAEAEGIRFLRDVPDADETLTPRQLFMCLWDSINEDRGLGWDVNPWVWVVEFKRIDA